MLWRLLSTEGGEAAVPGYIPALILHQTGGWRRWRRVTRYKISTHWGIYLDVKLAVKHYKHGEAT